MPKYCVAYISFFDNMLVQKVVEANSPEEACIAYLKDNDPSCDIGDLEDMSLEMIKDYHFDGDSAIDVIEI